MKRLSLPVSINAPLISDLEGVNLLPNISVTQASHQIIEANMEKRKRDKACEIKYNSALFEGDQILSCTQKFSKRRSMPPALKTSNGQILRHL